MEREAKNKIIVVTGGAEGIGFAVAEAFLKENVKNVIIVDINEEKGNEAAHKLNTQYGKGTTEFIKGDVNKDFNIVSTKIFDKFKSVDCLVNNAGILDEYSPRKVLEINTISMIEWSMAFFEHMRKDKGGNGGTIINMGSIFSLVVDLYSPVYRASKCAVMGFSRTHGHQQNYKMYGVNVLTICPGATASKMPASSIFWEDHSKEFRDYLATQTFQPTENVGNAAVKLFKTADSGTAWTVIDGVVALVP